MGPGGRVTSETAARRFQFQFQKRNGYEFIAVICNGHFPTDTNTGKCPFGCNGYVKAVAGGRWTQRLRLYSGVRMRTFFISVL
jgi:hypothetical protein